MRRRAVAVAVTLMAGALFPLSAAAVEGTGLSMAEEQRAAHLFEQLKCPVCKNQSLASSTSYIAEQMKRQIRDKIREGQTNEEIISFYVDRYGEWILTRPPASGRGLLVWLLPGALVLGAGGWLLLVLRRWSRAPDREQQVGSDVEPPSSQEQAAIRRLVREEGPEDV